MPSQAVTGGRAAPRGRDPAQRKLICGVRPHPAIWLARSRLNQPRSAPSVGSSERQRTCSKSKVLGRHTLLNRSAGLQVSCQTGGIKLLPRRNFRRRFAGAEAQNRKDKVSFHVMSFFVFSHFSPDLFGGSHAAQSHRQPSELFLGVHRSRHQGETAIDWLLTSCDRINWPVISTRVVRPNRARQCFSRTKRPAAGSGEGCTDLKNTKAAQGGLMTTRRGKRWRRLRDSNPGDAFTPVGFQDRCIRPLCQTSAICLP